MIYTVTFNPSLDYYMFLDRLNGGTVNRSQKTEILFGGKGLNVSYVLNQLGVENKAIAFIGGFTGDFLQKSANEAGINCDFISLKEGTTRINVKLKCENETDINTQGPCLSSADTDRLLVLLDNLNKGDILVLSGSLPPLKDRNLFEKIFAKLQDIGASSVLDMSGKTVLGLLKYKPLLIKPNLEELEDFFDEEMETDEKIVAAMNTLKNMGATNVLVSKGGDGALLLDGNGKLYSAAAVKVDAVNTVCSGDAMVAGFLAGYEKGSAYALKLGTAAGAANAATLSLPLGDDILNIFKNM